MSDWDPANGPVAEAVRAKTPGPWDLYLERIRRFEIHFNGPRIEMRRGPVDLEGYGLRVFRPAGDRVGVGFAAGTSPSAGDVAAVLADAESTAPLSRSPAKAVELPRPNGGAPAAVEVVDRAVWDRPEESIEAHAHALLEAVDPRGGVVVSFGSVRASLAEVGLVNSEGLVRTFPHTVIETELALKADGGPEGRPPGEYWVNRSARGIPTRGVAEEVRAWSQRAQDVRRAEPAANGPQNVVFPPKVLADILPQILGYRFAGRAALQKIAPAPDEEVASASISASDDGRLPMALGSAPVDDEGTPQGRTPLIAGGRAKELLVDRVHAAALERAPTGSGRRDGLDFVRRFRFTSATMSSASTLGLAPGTGGSDAELAEAAREGLWIDQLGWAYPDGTTSAFGGEIRLGYRIEHGRIGAPIRGGTVGGFAMGPPDPPPMLRAVRAVGSGPELVARYYGPSLLIGDFAVAGA